MKNNRRSGTVEVPVTILVRVHWETDEHGHDPKPIVGPGVNPSAVMGGARWRLPSEILVDPKVLEDVQTAIDNQANHAQKAETKPTPDGTLA